MLAQPILLSFKERKAALLSINPGDLVAYGWFIRPLWLGELTEQEAEEQVKTIRIVRFLDRKQRIMRFHYHRVNYDCMLVARGIEPCDRFRLEKVLKVMPLPKRIPQSPPVLFL